MSAMSCNKGKAGEREFAHRLTSEGFPATRGAQHRGGTDSPDVLCPSLPGVHFEIKRCERLRLYDALNQARSDAGELLPVVAHRSNGQRWIVVLELSDFLRLVREATP
jgi:Holliday junction resolvase